MLEIAAIGPFFLNQGCAAVSFSQDCHQVISARRNVCVEGLVVRCDSRTHCNIRLSLCARCPTSSGFNSRARAITSSNAMPSEGQSNPSSSKTTQERVYEVF